MSVSPKPRKRAVRLTPAALDALQRALAARWQEDARDGRLTREAQAELMGVSVATAKNILSGCGADRASFALAFKRLGLSWSDACCESLARDPEPSSVEPEPSLDLPYPAQPSPSTRARTGSRLALAAAFVSLVVWGTARTVRRLDADWGYVYGQQMDEALGFYYRAEYAKADVRVARALVLAREHDSADRIAYAVRLQGDLAGARGRLREAKARYINEVAFRNVVIDGAGKPAAYEALGDVETRLGEYASAKRHLILSLEGYRRFHDPVGVALAQRDLGSVLLGMGDLDAADGWLLQALEGLQGLAKPDIEADVRGRQALVLLARGRSAAARNLLLECLGHWKSKRQPRWIALTEMHLALCEARLGDLAIARARILRSRDAFARVGDEARFAEATDHLRPLVASAAEPRR